MKYFNIKNTTAIGSSFLTVIAPKFCCWSSALTAMGAGVSYLAWVHPMRPYLFGLSFLLVGFSFYKAYAPTNHDSNEKTTGCSTCEKIETPFIQSKLFTWLAAVFVITMYFIGK